MAGGCNYPYYSTVTCGSGAGLLEGLTAEEIRAAFPCWFPGKTWTCRGGIPSGAGGTGKNRSQYLGGDLTGHRVVVVSHGAFLRAFLVSCLQWDRPAPGNGEAVEVIWEEGVWKYGHMEKSGYMEEKEVE